MEEKKDTVNLPEAKNPIGREEADKMAALIKLDIAKYESEAARAQGTIDQAKFLIAQSKVALADLERRVLNVDYPAAQEKQSDGKAEAPADGTTEGK
jgi:hypothetical protein